MASINYQPTDVVQLTVIVCKMKNIEKQMRNTSLWEKSMWFFHRLKAMWLFEWVLYGRDITLAFEKNSFEETHSEPNFWRSKQKTKQVWELMPRLGKEHWMATIQPVILEIQLQERKQKNESQTSQNIAPEM